MSIAIIIGASPAGLAAAQALSRRFTHVTVVERRRGLPELANFHAPANVHVLEGMEAEYLLPSVDGVGGVAVRPRGDSSDRAVRYMMSTLVVCAIGDRWRAGEWMEGVGWHADGNRVPPGLLLIGGGGQNRGGIPEPAATFITV